MFYEGQKSDFILFVKSGTFEMTKTFGQEKNSHVAKSKTSGPLQSIIKKVQKDGKKLETVIEKDEKFVIEQMIRA